MHIHADLDTTGIIRAELHRSGLLKGPARVQDVRAYGQHHNQQAQ